MLSKSNKEFDPRSKVDYRHLAQWRPFLCSALLCDPIRLGDIYHLARSMMSGKSFALPAGWWPHEASRRLAVLCVTTVALLFARLQIMGSQLPVFTR
ncbi:hypothetical protein ZHAS_00017881 [Anopheles sinensis]|uniref:Uncharacterized protein n=1 Tax=Anopheles sinensis TaxID=74873 RepID=A0A084WI13_ANOSI|nr:hypothetical protein ZHAS_00017881 [Anopheles sinensis]